MSLHAHTDDANEAFQRMCDEMESALTYARAQSADDGCTFLSAWRDHLWDVIKTEFPDFPIPPHIKEEVLRPGARQARPTRERITGTA